jgi:anaerobic carbon-monoxide dehydrogenase iron sulfur subunit
MKEVVIHPERCVGCMQCMIACATAHSKSKQLHTAVFETPIPKPRIHVGVGLHGEGFPNRCRHCDPAPCLFACLPGAIFRDAERGSVFIDSDRCINCASCAMACPFGVIRYHEDCYALPGQTVAVKCDNCIERQMQSLVPACVEVCKAGALTFEEMARAMKRKTDEVARTVSQGTAAADLSPGFTLLQTMKKKSLELGL